MLFWEIFKCIVQNLMNSPKVVKCGIWTFDNHKMNSIEMVGTPLVEK